jgi:ABC-2 type transport system permease protein
MLWIMIKNNFKLMLRSKWFLGMMILGPVIVIAALSSAFHNIMKNNEELGHFNVGYQIAKTSIYAPYLEGLEKKEVDGITFVRYNKADPEQEIKNGTVKVFVAIEQDNYKIYSQKESEAQASMTQYFFYQIFHGAEPSVEIPVAEKEFVKIPSSINYYGKIEIVYFLWCSMILLSAVITSERKNRIQPRYKLSPATNLILYLAKVIPCFLAISIVMAGSTILSTIIFDIKWGCIVPSILMLLLGAVAVSTSAVILFGCISNVAVAVVIEFVLVWIFGFLGGSFESYLYSSMAEWLKKLSPVYYLNRVLVEYETNGSSAYTKEAVIFYLGIILVGFVIGSFVMKRKMEEQ